MAKQIKKPFVNIPYSDLASHSLSVIESLLANWIGGKRSRTEWQAEKTARGGMGDSLTVKLSTGEWMHGASSSSGGDLISLYAYLNGLDQHQAAIDVADQIGYQLPEGCRPAQEITPRQKPVVDPAAVKAAKPKKEETPWQPLTPVPADHTKAPLAHPVRGLPFAKWAYKSAGGELLGFVYRFNTSDGGKETLPLTYCLNSITKKHEWRWMQWQEPKRPLYGLDRLADKPDAFVLLVSGEKCADAAVDLLTRGVIVTWSGGDNAVDKIDWTPLAGRRIYAWADCDAHRVKRSKAEIEKGIDPESKPLLPEHEQSGIKAMLRIKQNLQAIDAATQFLMVNIPKPLTVPSGWDIADAVEDGWGADRLRDFILNTRDYEQIAQIKSADQPAEIKNDPAQNDDEWRLLLAKDQKGNIADTRENVFLMIANHRSMAGMLAYDQFALRIVKRRPAPWDYDLNGNPKFEGESDWSDTDSLELSYWVSQAENVSVRSMDNINHAVKLAASRNAYDPLVEYLRGLKWDGTKRCDYWLTDFVGVVKNPYTTMAGRMFLISMIARAFRPGCIMRTMPVFEGVQYRGKSSVARILAGRWFSDSPLDLKGKDGFINIQGVWLNEIAELGSFSNQETSVIKAYISSASDRFRSPFDKYSKNYPRRTVLFGTTNEDQYLRDKTGNSRFWPLVTEEVGNLDLDGLAIVRDQLLAEAVALFDAGERWHPLADEQKNLFEPEQRLRQHDDPWLERVAEYFEKETFITTSVSQVMSDCLKLEIGKQTPADGIRVGKIITSLGWKKTRPGIEKDAGRKALYNRPRDQALSNQSTGNDDDIPF
jgi:predicted P-loop ATPase